MSSGPGAPYPDDQPVGAVLFQMRKARELTGARLAAMVGMSQPKISRIEHGRGQVDPEDVGVIARALGAADDVVQALMDKAERSRNRMTDWRTASTTLTARQRTLQEWETAATAVRAFEPALVPGPLQTSGYAKLVIETFRRLSPAIIGEHSEAALLAAVSARLRRQEALADRSRAFHFVLGEAALKGRLYPPVEMLAQIAHLREVVAERPNVRLSVIPDDAPAEVPLLHGFFLYDDDLVVVDLYNTGLISRSHQDVETYRRVFDALEQQATDIGPLLSKYEDMYIDALRPTRAE